MVWSEPLNLSWKEKHLDKTTPSLPVSKYHKKCEKHLDMNLLLYVRPAVDQPYPLPSPLLVKKIIQHVFNHISKEDWGAASVGANYKVIAWIPVPPQLIPQTWWLHFMWNCSEEWKQASCCLKYRESGGIIFLSHVQFILGRTGFIITDCWIYLYIHSFCSKGR